MKRPHPFRFEARRTSRGRVYYVLYDADPAHPKSTGVAIPQACRTRWPGPTPTWTSSRP